MTPSANFLTIPAKICLLIPKLATPHNGELVATRDAIGRLLLSAGLDWHDLARAAGIPAPPLVTVSRTSAPSFGDLARAARDLDRDRLTPRERAFVADMCRRGFAFCPSPRQADWLASIFDQLQARAAA